jgi:hypothetical protein
VVSFFSSGTVVSVFDDPLMPAGKRRRRHASSGSVGGRAGNSRGLKLPACFEELEPLCLSNIGRSRCKNDAEVDRPGRLAACAVEADRVGAYRGRGDALARPGLLLPYLWIWDQVTVAQYELISRNVLTDDDLASPHIKADVERRGSGVVYARRS